MNRLARTSRRHRPIRKNDRIHNSSEIGDKAIKYMNDMVTTAALTQKPVDVVEVLDIKAYGSPDGDYKGIWVSIEDEDLVLVEYDLLEGKYVIRVWDNENPNGDYYYKQIID